MSQVATVFQISIYSMIALSSIMLAIAEGVAFPQGATTPLVVLAFFLTERWKVFRIRPLVAFILGILAFLLAASELATDNIEARLLSGTHLVVYLSWIVLFQEKELRMYWWMCALSVLQVALGSVLTNEGSFGILLVGYLFLAFWTLSVFSLHQAQRRLAGTQTSSDTTPPAVVLSGPESQSAASLRVVETTGATPRMGSLLRLASTARSSIRQEPHEGWISPRFICGTMLAGGLSLLIAACFFALIPRIWIGQLSLNRDDPRFNRPILTGFSDEVQLGEIGDILESTDRVMEVGLFDNRTDQRLNVQRYAAAMGYSEPFFRGRALEEYRGGRWIAETPEDSREIRSDSSPNMVRQEIRLEPTGSQILFAMRPALSVDIHDVDARVSYEPVTKVFVRPREVSARKSISYSVFARHPRPRATGRFPDLPTVGQGDPSPKTLALPKELQRLRVLAREVAGIDGDVTPPKPLETALQIQSFLRDSDQFTYSLDASVTDPTIDPVEDFLFNRKSGHCEYYASSLALMLRAVGIPSRLVNGFKGGYVDEDTYLYLVEERHAHAWVEALIRGRWVVLDATPAARAASVESMNRPQSTWSDVANLVKSLWIALINMNLEQQRELVYDPLSESASAIWSSANGQRPGVAGALNAIKDFLISPRRWISWQGGLATFVLLGAAVLLWLAARFGSTWQHVWAKLLPRGGGRRTQIAFYERFRKLCRAHGLVREPSQTQREFADAMRQSFSDVLRRADLTDFPPALIESFYHVRFGRQALNVDRAREIDRQLGALEEALARGNGAPGSP